MKYLNNYIINKFIIRYLIKNIFFIDINYIKMFNIINLLLLFAIIYIIYKSINNMENMNNVRDSNFNLQDQNIDNLFVIQRGKEYANYISNMYDDKKILFSDKELRDLKKKSQTYDITNINDPKNITVQITDALNKNDNLGNYNDFSNSNELIKDSNLEYVTILHNIDKDINKPVSFTCDDIAVLNNPRYLKNYYLDMFGNNVESNLEDYFANYQTIINNKNETKAIPVKTIKGNSNMIIPDQYNTNKYLSNAYNVDWSRVINPYTIY